MKEFESPGPIELSIKRFTKIIQLVSLINYVLKTFQDSTLWCVALNIILSRLNITQEEVAIHGTYDLFTAQRLCPVLAEVEINILDIIINELNDLLEGNTKLRQIR